MNHRSKPLNYAERWMREGLETIPPAGFFLTQEVDMSEAKRVIAAYKQAGHLITYTHILIRLTAIVLARHPELHRLVNGKKYEQPDHVDIGVSINGNYFIAPVYVVCAAETKNVHEIKKELHAGAPLAVAQQEKDYALWRRWGWSVPFSSIRRIILRKIMHNLKARRKMVGTFQITCMPKADKINPLLFQTSGILAMGAIKNRPMVVDNNVMVRPTAFITCGADHRVWNGMNAARILDEV